MSPLPHRVRRLSFQVRATSSGEALALRAALHQQIDTVTAAMTRALDAAGAGDAIVHLPRLEVRARIASVDEVGDALAQRIEHALRRELSARPGRSPGTDIADTGAVDARGGTVE
ncbi:MAG TPA: contractile injection system tape measure protein, partial [Kofleriaceae bacterium]